MKQSKLLFLLVVLLSMTSYNSYAYDYDIAVENTDGVTIYYNFINEGTELEVTGKTQGLQSWMVYTGSVNIPEEVTYMNKNYKVTSIGEKAFFRSESYLNYVTIPKSVTSIGDGAFQGCSGLTSFIIPPYVTTIGSYAFMGCNRLTSITIPNGVSSINSQTFQDCSSLASVVIPNSVISIGSGAFSGTAITTVDIPNSVISIGGGAYNETPWFNEQPDGLIYINNFAYRYKGSMPENTVINILEGTKGICGYAFNNCNNLTSIILPNSLTTIGNSAFSGCTNLSTITIPESVIAIETAAFSECSNLSSITIPNNVVNIGSYSFRGCTNLSSITISNNVETIYGHTFSGCSKLESVIIPNGVTSIGNEAFRDCESLTSVTFGSKLTSIDYYAFKGCKALRTVKSYIKEPYSINNNIFENDTYRQGTLYVPMGTMNLYARFDGWREFLKIEEMDSSEHQEIPGAEKCATPTIDYQNGTLTFGCETEGATCQYAITNEDIKSGSGNEVQLGVTYHISVYATKDGYEDSDVATKEIKLSNNTGDMNGDKKVDAADIVKLVNIIMTQQNK